MRDKISSYVSTWKRRGYPAGIPDEADRRLEDFNKAPSWRLICIAVLKNDVTLKTLGYAMPECHLYNELKREEIKERGGLLHPEQLRMF